MRRGVRFHWLDFVHACLSQATVENCLVMALVWGVGGTVDEEGRVLFSHCLRGFLKGKQLKARLCWVTK